jgi:hypothetical protein
MKRLISCIVVLFAVSFLTAGCASKPVVFEGRFKGWDDQTAYFRTTQGQDVSLYTGATEWPFKEGRKYLVAYQNRLVFHEYADTGEWIRVDQIVGFQPAN